MGRVKSIARFSDQGHWLNECILKQYDNRHGYKYIDLYTGLRDSNRKKIRKYVHRLVAEYFVANPNCLPEVDHIDTNRSNNVYTNLRWCTHKGNYENQNTKANAKEAHKNDRPSKEQIEKMRKRVAVYKDGQLIHIFPSYSELDQTSKSIIGIQLWNVYARQVVKGFRNEYHGYTFKIV